jgi:hypothetical protein
MARSILENNYKASGSIKKPERTFATGEFDTMQPRTESGITSNAKKPLFDKILIANR